MSEAWAFSDDAGVCAIHTPIMHEREQGVNPPRGMISGMRIHPEGMNG